MNFSVVFWISIFQIVASLNDFQMILILPPAVGDDIEGAELDHHLGIQGMPTSSNRTNIDLTVVEDLSCLYSYSGESLLPEFIKHIFYNRNVTIIGAAGFLCPQGRDIITGLIKGDLKRNLDFPFFFFSPSRQPSVSVHPNIFHMVGPLDTLGASLVSFLKNQRWLRVSFITGPDDSQFSFTAEKLATYMTAQQQITIAKYLQVENGRELDWEGFEARVVLLVMGEVETTEVLCSAHLHGLRWPHYAWIVLSLSHSPFHLDSDSCNLEGSASEFEVDLTGIILVNFESPGNPVMAGSAKCNTGHSYLADLACDSINIALFAHNHCQNLGLECFNNLSYLSHHAGHLSYNEDSHTLFSLVVEFAQFRIDKNIKVAYYNSSLFILNTTLLDNLIPSRPKHGSLYILSRTIYFTTTLIMLVLLTTSFILFLIFKKEPEVKASSFSLTFLIYLSSYVLVFYLFILAMKELVDFPVSVKNATCIARSWLNVISFQGPLVSAITIVKIFRIYRIFHPTKLSHGGKCLSDQLLMVIVMILQIPSFIIILLWNITDPYLSVKKEVYHTNYIETKYNCDSKHLRTWTFLLLSYNILLGVVLIFVAIKTRKIRKKNFKDTKKVNVFVFLYILIVSLCLGLFLVGRATNSPDFTLGVLHSCTSILIILTVTLFFSPKLYPPLRREFVRRTTSNMNAKASSMHSIASRYTSYTSLPR